MRIVIEDIPAVTQTEVEAGRRLGSHRLICGFPGASVDYRNFRTTMNGKAVGPPGDLVGPESFAAADVNWGEQDSLASIPRKKQETWVKLATRPDVEEGDR